MHPNAIPDSEPAAPALDPRNPQWLDLGSVNAYLNSSPALSAAEGSADRTSDCGASVELTNQLPAENVAEVSTEEADPVEKVVEKLAEEVADEVAVQVVQKEVNAPIQVAEPHLPRRRRFDFDKWVADEKKTHEFVYHRKLDVFHGAKSDSEDSDFEVDTAVLETANAPFKQVDDELDPSIEFDTYEVSDSADTNSLLQRKRRKIYNSSSSEESDESDESDEELVLPVFKQRLHKPIPASKMDSALPATELPSSSPQFDAMPSLPESLPTSLPVEAKESRAPFDYMLPRRPRRPRSLEDVITELGPSAPLSLRVAARTKARKSTISQRRATRTSSKPASKPSSVRKKSRQTTEKFFKGPLAKQARKTIRRWRRDEQPPNRAKPALIQSKLNVVRRKRPRKPARRREEVSPQLFHSTVLERQIQGRARPRAKPKPKLTSSQEFNPSGPISQPEISMHSPRAFISTEQMSNYTFLGSNLYEIITIPEQFNGLTRSESAFSVPIQKTSIETVRADGEKLLALMSGKKEVSLQLYESVYEYFFAACGFLCDESQIVDSGFRWAVMREWVRVALAALQTGVVNRKKYELELIEVCVLASLTLSRRVCMMEGKGYSKVNQLACWAVFLHQQVISAQIDNGNNERLVPGVELVHCVQYFGVCDAFLGVLSKADFLAGWHLLVVLSAVKLPSAWHSWDFARLVCTKNMRQAAVYALVLILKWKWPPSAEIVVDLFDFYARQQHYADPDGERIWVPAYILKTEFDGRLLPNEEFLRFLELLGCTLLKLQTDLAVCRRIAGRVTPLSALQFPETREISTADLSAASHQYGILIVLLRCMPANYRPSIAQFRDLVVLDRSHLAIKVKAASAWCIVAQCVDTSDLSECCAWMREDILGFSAPETLVAACVQCAIEVVKTGRVEAVPVAEIAKFGFKSQYEQLKTSVWQLLEPLEFKILEPAIKLVMQSGHASWSETDFSWFRKLCFRHPSLAYLWDAPKLQLFTDLVDANLLANTDKEYILAAVSSAASLDRVSSVISNADVELCTDILQRIRKLADSEYVSAVRSLVFEQYPQLLQTNQWGTALNIELARVSILRAFNRTAFTECEYFFVYKLRTSLNSDNGASFAADMANAVRFYSPNLTLKAAHFVFSELFVFYIYKLLARNSDRVVLCLVQTALAYLNTPQCECMNRFVDVLVMYAKRRLEHSQLINGIFTFATAWIKQTNAREQVCKLYTLGHQLHALRTLGFVRPFTDSNEIIEFEYAFDEHAITSLLETSELSEPASSTDDPVDAFMLLAAAFESKHGDQHGEQHVYPALHGNLLAPACDPLFVYDPPR